MRVRDHIAFSTATAAIARPWLGRDAIWLWAGGVLIDADHYAWFCLSQRRVNPRSAVQFFNGAHAPQHPATRALHDPRVLLGAVLLGPWHRCLMPLAIGMSLHVALDRRHEARLDRARALALKRDDHACRACGTRAFVGTHLWRQPWLLPSYRVDGLVSLCGPCHELAHEGSTGEVLWS